MDQGERGEVGPEQLAQWLGEAGQCGAGGVGVVEQPGLFQRVEQRLGGLAPEADPFAGLQQRGPVVRPVEQPEEVAEGLVGVFEHPGEALDGTELQGLGVPPAAGEGGLQQKAHGSFPSDRFRTADGSMPDRPDIVRCVVHRRSPMIG